MITESAQGAFERLLRKAGVSEEYLPAWLAVIDAIDDYTGHHNELPRPEREEMPDAESEE